MRVFVTGATGFVGTAVTAELIGAGHQVLGLTRSPEGARALEALGAQAHSGALEDLAGLAAGAAQADGVIHLAFNHDFSTYQANCEDDRRVVSALAAALAGSERPLVVTSGAGISTAGPGRTAREDDPPASSALIPRAASEEAAQAAADQGINASVVRLPQVHDTQKHGLITYAIELARAKGVSAYVGEGANRWTACHVSDVARLYRLALERAERGARYHAIAEEGIAMRAIAEAVGRRVGVPARSITAEEAPAHFGWMAMFATHDVPASSALTRETLGWTPTGPGLIADIEAG